MSHIEIKLNITLKVHDNKFFQIIIIFITKGNLKLFQICTFHRLPVCLLTEKV